MRTLAALATIGLVGFLAGCSSDSNSRCTRNSDCSGGQVCDTGVCKAPSSRTIGEPCTSDANCSVGSSCATAMPGGLCTYNCAGDTCPSGAVCTDLRASGSGMFCSKGCTTDADCRGGYTCCAGFGACLPAANCPQQRRAASTDLGKPCTSPAQCTAVPGEICVGSAPNTNPEFPGGACTAACNPADQSTCPSGSSCVSTSTGAFCFAPCGSNTDCSAALNCSSGLCRAPNAPPSCTPNGTAPAAESGGVSGPANAPSGCQRAVQSSVSQSIPSGQQMVGNTITFTVPPGTGSISILSQGITTATPITVSGGTQPLDTITFRGSTIANSVVPTLLKDPNGTTIYDDDPPTAPPADPSGLDAFYGGFSPWTGMMTVPNAAPLLAHTALQGGLTPGTWQFKVNDFALECTSPAHTTDCSNTGSKTGVYDIQVLLKPGVAPASGTIDIAFYVLYGSATAASTIADRSFTRMLSSLAKLYAAAGLCIGKVTVYDVPSWARTKFGGSLNADDDSACGDLGQLFTLAAPGNQINLFLVNGFKTASGTPIQIVGVDGSIPGPSTVGGTISSGAAVNGSDLDVQAAFCPASGFDPLNCGADEVAYIAAHEGGHFMGLYHPTEQFGDSFDPLSDTKTCACSSCVIGQNALANCASNHPAGTPTQVTNNFCVSTTTTPQCGGGDNLMFWLLRPESKGTLTPQQGQVMRANPVVR